MWGVPFGSRVRITNLATGLSTIATIKDRGPAKRLHRVIDLSKFSFEQIADPKQGVINVTAEVL